jgi:hypothetical protein
LANVAFTPHAYPACRGAATGLAAFVAERAIAARMSADPLPASLLSNTAERELTAPVDLCDDTGRLNRAAVGWSRFPMHRCNLSGGWPARKRWDFWAVMCDTHLLMLTYGCTDYLGLLSVGWLDYSVGKRVEATRSPLLARGMTFSETVGGSTLHYEDARFAIDISEEANATRLRGRFESGGHRLNADVRVERPDRHETLNVVIPWGDSRFQFTSKQNTRPAAGSVELDGRTYRFDCDNHAYGILDFGRGVWPYKTTWNWAAASGSSGGHVVGLNLGGKWTDRTGYTENGACIDGRLHKIGEDLVWVYDRGNFMQPWHITAPQSGRVDLHFEPRIPHRQRSELVLLRSELIWAFGSFSGTVVGDDGEVVRIDNLPGWAEEHRARW